MSGAERTTAAVDMRAKIVQRQRGALGAASSDARSARDHDERVRTGMRTFECDSAISARIIYAQSPEVVLRDSRYSFPVSPNLDGSISRLREASRMASVACIPFLASLGLMSCDDKAPAPETPSFYAQMDSQNARVDPAAARDMISIYRAGKGLATLTIDPELQTIAQSQSDAMARANSTNANAAGALPSRLAKSKLKRTVAVENVSAGYHTLAEAFSGWRQSPPHNSNMLNPKARRIGIATTYAPTSKYKVFWALVLTD